MAIKIAKLEKCARCGGVHDDIVFAPFNNPIKDSENVLWPWYALCPANNEPILMRKTSDDGYAQDEED